MAEDIDTRLTNRAARVVRDAVQVYRWCNEDSWLAGFNPVLTAWTSGMFGDLATQQPPAAAGPAQASDHKRMASLQRVFRLPYQLPAVLLPRAPELAKLARTAPLMLKLEELAHWLGRDGRPVGEDDLLARSEAADAAQWLDIRPEMLTYLWEYALTSGWIELVPHPNGRWQWAVIGDTALRWSDHDVMGTLCSWAVVFAAVLATKLEVPADQAPEAARRLNFQGQGVALAIILFLARGIGVTEADAHDIIRDGAIGTPPTRRDKKAWDAWVQEFGDPARRLLSELVALGALVPPSRHNDACTLTPLSQWALREQLRLEDIAIPLLVTPGELTIEDLVSLAGGVPDPELEARLGAWSSGRKPSRAVLELLQYGLSASAHGRVRAVSLARRLGPAAGSAWLRAVANPRLSGYARIALSGDQAELPPAVSRRLQDPRDAASWKWVAADLLSLIGMQDAPSPHRVVTAFAAVVPAGQEAWVIREMHSDASPDVRHLLEVLARFHPDPVIARDAAKAKVAPGGRG